MQVSGQAALEFLVTYGWAFLAMTIAISTLGYFGVLNPGQYLPNKCSFSSDFICEDFRLTGHDYTAGNRYNVSVQLRHTFGETILLHNVTCHYPNNDGVGTWTPSPQPMEWQPKETAYVSCEPDGAGSNFLVSGEKEEVTIDINYKFDTSGGGYMHTAEGQVFASVR